MCYSQRKTALIIVLISDGGKCVVCTCIMKSFVHDADDITFIHRMYNACPEFLTRGVDADATEVILSLLEALRTGDLVEHVVSRRTYCSACSAENTTYEVDKCMVFYIHSSSHSSITHHLRKQFEEGETTCPQCSQACSEKPSFEIVMDFFIVQVFR